MLLKIITLSTLVIVIVSPLLLTRLIWSNTRKDRELLRLRDEKALQLTRRVEQVALQAIKTEQFIMEHHLLLDAKIDEVTRFIETHNNSVNSHLRTFDLFLKSDMVAARRDELTRSKELKVALERLVGVSTLSRQAPSVNDMLAIDSLTRRIKDLEEILDTN